LLFSNLGSLLVSRCRLAQVIPDDLSCSFHRSPELCCSLPHARRGIVAVVSLTHSMALSQQLSACPAWHHRSGLPHALRGIVVVFPVIFVMPRVGSSSPRPSMVSLSSRCLPHALRGLWYARQSSILSGAAASVRGRLPSRAVVSSPARRSCRCVRQASFMRSSLLSCPARKSVCVAVLRSVRHGRWYAWRSSDLCGMHGGLPSCPARLSVCAAGFLHMWRPSVLLGVVVSVRGRLPSCVAVFRSARCGYR